jgi:hypothetical protein
MHPELERQLADQRVEQLRAAGAGRDSRTKEQARASSTEVVLRAARSDDDQAIAALAALDGAFPPVGPALVAEVDGSIQAALPLDGGRALADPFRRTRDLVTLLEARAAQLGRGGSHHEHRRLSRLTPAGLRRLV